MLTRFSISPRSLEATMHVLYLRQHDAQEFLVHLLEGLQKDLSRVSQTSRLQDLPDNSNEWDSLP